MALRLAELIVPRVCANCGSAIPCESGELCLRCWDDLQQVIAASYCRTCGDDRAAYLLPEGQCTRCRLRTGGRRWDGFIKVGRYDGVLKSLILRFKHRFILDRLLGELLSHAILSRLDSASVDHWVPIPAHWRRRLLVGFQPTALLARSAVRPLGRRFEPVLAATRYVPPFHLREGMSAADRAEAVKGAFRPAGGCSLEGRTVCLIDDVTTTGATLREARRVVLEAGAQRVFAAVLATAASSRGSAGGLDQRVRRA
jgi:ComF family protein